jgi:hypothetical protein
VVKVDADSVTVCNRTTCAIPRVFWIWPQPSAAGSLWNAYSINPMKMRVMINRITNAGDLRIQGLMLDLVPSVAP